MKCSRPRPIRFTVRTLVLVVTAACILLAIYVNRIRQHSEAIAAIREWRGSNVLFAHQVDWSTRKVDRFADAPDNRLLRMLFGEDALLEVDHLFVDDRDREITDADLQHLRALPTIRVLALNCPEITDSSLENLKNLKQMRQLSMNGENITDTGLKHLQGLKQLKELAIHHGKEITDSGLMNLATLTSLEDLQLNWLPRVTDEGRYKLQEALPTCRIWYSLPGEVFMSRRVEQPGRHSRSTKEGRGGP